MPFLLLDALVPREVLDDDDALEALRESEADVRAGRVYSLDEVRRELGLA